MTAMYFFFHAKKRQQVVKTVLLFTQLFEELWRDLRLVIVFCRASFHKGCDHFVGELSDAFFAISPHHRDFDDLNCSLQFGDFVPLLIFFYITEIFRG